jgi:hypothetical protein
MNSGECSVVGSVHVVGETGRPPVLVGPAGGTLERVDDFSGEAITAAAKRCPHTACCTGRSCSSS